jgi:hypothetical protein
MLLLAATMLACPDGGCASSSPPPYEARPPTPPPPRGLPPELAEALPRTDAGLPILLTVPLQVAPGFDLQLVYDESLDDPLARWDECLGRVVACAEANAGHPIDGCIGFIEPCADDTGGQACCPPACIAAYHERRSAGDEEEQALLASFFAGDCVAGLRAQLDAAADAGGEFPTDGGIWP